MLSGPGLMKIYVDNIDFSDSPFGRGRLRFPSVASKPQAEAVPEVGTGFVPVIPVRVEVN